MHLEKTLFIVLLCLLTAVYSHSWIDCAKYDVKQKKCVGYSRGYPGRENPKINDLYTYVFNAKPINQAICEPKLQSKPNYSTKYPMGTARRGERIYQVWQANGHLNNTKPTKIKVLYYKDPKRQVKVFSEKCIADVAGEMTFATNKNCANPQNPNTICANSWVVPLDLIPNTVYNFVWLWDFGFNPAGQEYSTCFDLLIK